MLGPVPEGLNAADSLDIDALNSAHRDLAVDGSIAVIEDCLLMPPRSERREEERVQLRGDRFAIAQNGLKNVVRLESPGPPTGQAGGREFALFRGWLHAV